MPGEIDCGDAWHLVSNGEHTAVIVVDGLGHGTFAARGGAGGHHCVHRIARWMPPQEIMHRAATAMSRTRGGAAACAQFDKDGAVSLRGRGQHQRHAGLARQIPGPGFAHSGIARHASAQRVQQFEYQRDSRHFADHAFRRISARGSPRQRPQLLRASSGHHCRGAVPRLRPRSRRCQSWSWSRERAGSQRRTGGARGRHRRAARGARRDQQGRGGAVCRARRQGRATARRERSQEPVSLLHEPRVPHAAHLDDQHRGHPAVAARRTADARTAEAGGIHPRLGARAHRDGQRPARSRQGRGRPHHHLARVVRDGGPVRGAAWHVQAHRCRPRRCRCSSTSPRARSSSTPTTRSCRRSCAISFPTRSSSRPRARCASRRACWMPTTVEFAVTDTGIGIAAEHLPNLFADFVQLDVRLQRRLRGSGLGLSLARKFAELLGGTRRRRERARQGLALLGGDCRCVSRGAAAARVTS